MQTNWMGEKWEVVRKVSNEQTICWEEEAQLGQRPTQPIPKPLFPPTASAPPCHHPSATGNNIGEVILDTTAACKQPNPQETEGVVSVTKTLPPRSDWSVDGPSTKLWPELPPMLVQQGFFQVPERSPTRPFFLVPSLAYQISTRPFFTSSIDCPIWMRNGQMI